MKITFTILATCVAHFTFAQCNATYGKVVINEVMPLQTNIAANPLGEFEDWVELYNASEDPVNLNGYYLSDGRTNRTKFEFPDTTINPGQHIIVWCDGNIDLPGLHADFSLTSDGEQVVFSDPDTVLVDYMRYTEAFENVSIGRFPSGFGPWTTMVPTFETVNTNGQSLNLVINEYMARNSNVIADPFGEFDDWIEVHNTSNVAINLNGYFLSDGPGNPDEFRFPSVVIPAQGYIIVWADNQPDQGNLHAIFGLSGDGDDIMLCDPDTNTIDFVTFGPQIQNVPEGRIPNGLGPITCPSPTPAAANIPAGPNSVWDHQAGDVGISVWPNPAGAACVMSHTGQSPIDAEIFDIRGTLVRRMVLMPEEQTVRLTDLAPGVYLINSPFGTKRLLKVP
jgi:hypothetical protein